MLLVTCMEHVNASWCMGMLFIQQSLIRIHWLWSAAVLDPTPVNCLVQRLRGDTARKAVTEASCISSCRLRDRAYPSLHVTWV